MNSTTKVLAAIGVAAVIGFGVYAINESQKSDIEKAADDVGDAIEDVADEID